jgi:group I intron endonuclease
MYFLVYKVTNQVNGKSYIGITGRTISIRWSEHLSGSNLDIWNSRLYAAIRKYGKESFVCGFLARTTNEDKVRKLETFYINKFDTYHNGYNANLGGCGWLIITDEIKEKIRVAQLGKYIPRETRYKMSKAKKGNKDCAMHFGNYRLKGASSPRSISVLSNYLMEANS